MNIEARGNIDKAGKADEPIGPPKDASEKAAQGSSRQGRREKAILALLEHSSVDRAAQAVGIHPSTLWRWLKQPEFQEALRRTRQQVYSQAMGRVHQGANAAVGTVFRIMADPRASDHDRLQAAKYVLDKAGTCVELDALEDLQQRVTTIEKGPHGPHTPKA